MRKYLRIPALFISFVFLSTPIIQVVGEPRITLRSSPKDVSVAQIESMSNISIRGDNEEGIYLHSTINHSYESKSINGDSVVIDHATGLMWPDSGLEANTMFFWSSVSEEKGIPLNRGSGYAGFQDWRLPTLEEAVSLLESSRSHGLFIDPIINKGIEQIFTSDVSGQRFVWEVSFAAGSIRLEHNNFASYMVPVRSEN
jgi:hypothetical protein